MSDKRNDNIKSAEDIVFEDPKLFNKMMNTQRILEEGRGQAQDKAEDELLEEITNTQFPVDKKKGFIQGITDAIKLRSLRNKLNKILLRREDDV